MPGQTLESVFEIPASFGLDQMKLKNALRLDNGKGKKGAAKKLMQAAIAALLNSSHPHMNYPRTTEQIIAEVNAALATKKRTPMMELARQLEADNNRLCILD